jgi:DNA invertase Pin-like site-specific DNA recombinase
VERQLEVGIAYAQEQGLSYVVFTDRTSAYRKEVVRRDYEAILNAIRARRLKRVVSYKIDRQYRQVEELMDVIKIADRGRVPLTLIGVDDEDVFDLTTAKGCDEAIGRVLEAQRESRRTSERVRNQRRKAREQGIPSPGPAAFGWRDKLHHDEVEAEVLRQAYRSFLHGSSLKAIGDRWHEAGLKGARGGIWTVSTVKRVLTNPRNAGRLTHTYETFDDQGNKRTVTEVVRTDAFEAIVDPETFDAVQRELARRSKPQRHPRHRSMLTGLIRCGRCGLKLKRAAGRGRPIYRCWTGNIGPTRGCGLTISAEYLEPFIEDSLFGYVDSPEFARSLAERHETGSRRAELAGERDRLIKRRDWLRKQMLAGNYDDDLSEYEQDVRELGEQIRQVDAQLAEFQSVHPAAQWMGNGAGLREAWGARFDNDERRTLIEDAFGHIAVKAVGFRVGGFDPKRIELGVDFTVPGP